MQILVLLALEALPPSDVTEDRQHGSFESSAFRSS